MNKKNYTKVAVIGCGYWGKNLVRVFNELGALLVICDIDKEKLKIQSEKYPNIKIFGVEPPPDDNIQGSHTDIRPKEELEKWLSKDPITRFEEKLNDKSLLPKEKIKEIKHKVELEVKSAIQFAEQSLEPKEGDITKYVFSE